MIVIITLAVIFIIIIISSSSSIVIASISISVVIVIMIMNMIMSMTFVIMIIPRHAEFEVRLFMDSDGMARKVRVHACAAVVLVNISVFLLNAVERDILSKTNTPSIRYRSYRCLVLLIACLENPPDLGHTFRNLSLGNGVTLSSQRSKLL